MQRRKATYNPLEDRLIPTSLGRSGGKNDNMATTISSKMPAARLIGREFMQSLVVDAAKTPSFSSDALYIEMRLQELRHAAQSLEPHSLPHVAQTALACHLLDRFSSLVPPKYLSLFNTIKSDVLRSVYRDWDFAQKTDPKSDRSEEFYVSMSPWFEEYRRQYRRRGGQQEEINSLQAVLLASRKKEVVTDQKLELFPQFESRYMEMKNENDDLKKRVQHLQTMAISQKDQFEIISGLRTREIALNDEIKELQKELERLKYSVDQEAEMNRLLRSQMENMVAVSELEAANYAIDELTDAVRNAKATIAEQADQISEMERASSSLTPRPDLPDSIVVVAPNVGTSTNAKMQWLYSQVDFLTKRLSGEKSNEQYLKSAGGDTSLRGGTTNKGVKQEGISMAQLRSFLSELWAAKVSSERGKKKEERVDMSTFFKQFTEQKFGEEAAEKWAFDILSALFLYDHKHDCKLFAGMLTGTLHESVFAQQIRLIADLHKKLAAQDAEINKKKQGKLRRKDFLSSLAKIFPNKSGTDLLDLERTLGNPPPVFVNYESFFQSVDDHPFLETLCKQMLADRDEYLADIRTQLNDSNLDEYYHTNFANAVAAIQACDKAKPLKDARKYALLGFDREQIPQPDEDVTLTVEDFMANLSKYAVERSSSKSLNTAFLERMLAGRNVVALAQDSTPSLSEPSALSLPSIGEDDDCVSARYSQEGEEERVRRRSLLSQVSQETSSSSLAMQDVTDADRPEVPSSKPAKRRSRLTSMLETLGDTGRERASSIRRASFLPSAVEAKKGAVTNKVRAVAKLAAAGRIRGGSLRRSVVSAEDGSDSRGEDPFGKPSGLSTSPTRDPSPTTQPIRPNTTEGVLRKQPSGSLSAVVRARSASRVESEAPSSSSKKEDDANVSAW